MGAWWTSSWSLYQEDPLHPYLSSKAPFFGFAFVFCFSDLPFVNNILCRIALGWRPSLGACNYPIFLSWSFHRPIYFSNSDPHRNLSDQLQSQARTNVDMPTWCRHIHVRPHCFILSEACSCRLELAYFAGKISKNRLVCKNAVALAYYESCRLLVMSSCVRFLATLLSIVVNR